MSEELVIKHCSPTLAGMKTGSLFGCKCKSKEELIVSLRKLNNMLTKKGVVVVPLKFENERALIYVYRPRKLKYDLSTPIAKEILLSYGYDLKSINSCITHLIKRIEVSSSFPHEIGLFLGYPDYDVKGFISKGSRASIYTGKWKVYDNLELAIKAFNKYDKCTSVYLKKWYEGVSFLRLTVAVR